MAIELAFNPPQFYEQSYNKETFDKDWITHQTKMRQLVDELERLHAALTRDVDEEGVGIVDSVFGRTGDVTALQADYDAFFLTPAEGDAAYAPLGSGVVSFNTRTGAVTPQQSDYDSFFLTPAEGNAAYSALGHTHLLAAGATDVTATFGELNLLDLSGLTTGWALLADSATTASWQELPAGGFAFDTFDYNFDTDTAVSDPGTGDIKFNNATPNSVSSVVISETDQNSNSLALLMGRLTDGSMVRIQDAADTTIFQNYIITAITDNGTWRNLQVNPGGNSGTIPANGAAVKVLLQEAPYVANPTIENALYYGEPGLAGSPVNGLIEFGNMRLSGQPNSSVLEFWDEGGHRWDITVNGAVMTMDAVDAVGTSFVVRSDSWTFQAEASGLPNVTIGNNSMTLSHQNVAHADAMVMYIHERDAARGDIVDYGQLWVLDAGNHLMYTNESGTDFNLTNIGASGTAISSGWSTTSGGSITLGAGAPLFYTEQATNDTPAAGQGQVWVRNDVAPNTLMFTDDEGTDWNLLSPSGTIADGTTTDATLRWSGSAWVENVNVLSFAGGNMAFSALGLSDTTPGIELHETDASATNKKWTMAASSEQAWFATTTDASAFGEFIWRVDRTGTVVDNMDIFTDLRVFESTGVDSIQLIPHLTSPSIDFDGASTASFTGPTSAQGYLFDQGAQFGGNLTIDAGVPTLTFEISGTSRASMTALATSFTIDVSTQSSGNFIDFANGLTSMVTIDATNGLRVFGGGQDVDYMEFDHNGTDAFTRYLNTTWHRFDGISASGGWLFLDGGEIRVYDSTSVDYIRMFHDGANAQIDTNAGAILMPETLNLQDNLLTRPVLDDYSLVDTNATVSSNAVTCTYSTSQSYEVDLEAATGNVTITVSGGPPTNRYGEMIIKIQQDSTADRTLTWAGGTFVWPGGTEVEPKTGSDAITIYYLSTWNAGSTWYINGVEYG